VLPAYFPGKCAIRHRKSAQLGRCHRLYHVSRSNMNNPFIITLFIFSILLIVACGIGMWYFIIMSICNSQRLDAELYKKWGSPTARGYLYNPKDQMAIIMATMQIVFSSSAELTQNITLRNRFRRVRWIVLYWNIGICCLAPVAYSIVAQIRV